MASVALSTSIPRFIHARVHILILCTVLGLFAFSSAANAKINKTKKEVQQVETDEDDALPQPDAIIPALTPQPEMAPEVEIGSVNKVVLQHHTPNRRIAGIDVSHYQGSINWHEVARSGDVAYVYIKATEGANLVDNTYRTNLNGAKRAGLRVGIYHFYIPSVSPQLQFNNLRNTVNLREMDLLPIIDIERRGREPLQQFQRNLRAFIQLVERHYGVKPVLYCSRDFYNKYLSGPFTNYKYMVARYAEEVPQLCDNAAFVMWQYSATSRVRGIRGNVDRSCFMDHYTVDDILIRPSR